MKRVGKRKESRVPDRLDRRCICRGSPGDGTRGITRRTVWRGQYGKDAEKLFVIFLSRLLSPPNVNIVNDSFCSYHGFKILIARNRLSCSVCSLALHEFHDAKPTKSLQRPRKSIISPVLSKEASNHNIPTPCSHIEWQICPNSSYHLGLELGREVSYIARSVDCATPGTHSIKDES